MQHLDEGTIHSWIDGEVDAARSREIEAHLAGCSTCSAAVAEARGLVAASSRILTALDDVPGGVVPKRVAPPMVKPAKRQWRAGAWVTGIAAALVLAIGVSELSQDKPTAYLETEIADQRAAKAREALQSLATDTALARVASPDVPTQVTANEAARLKTVPTVLRRDRAPAAVSGDARAGLAADMAAPGPGRVASSAPAPAPASPMTAPQVAAVAEPTTARKLESAANKAVAQEAPTAAASASREMRAAADELETTRFVGCYRIERADDRRTVERVTAAAGAGAKAAATLRGRAAPSAAAPSAAADFAPPAPGMVRLDTARQPLGFAARDAFTNVSVGTWRGVSPDSARVDLLAAGLFKVALRNRTPCPER